MPQRTLYLLGASVRAAAFSACRAGWAPVALDCFADFDLAARCEVVRVENYPDDFLRLFKQLPRRPWLYTGGLENHPDLVEQLARCMPLWGNDASVLRQVRDPWRVAEVLREAGFAVPALRAVAAADPPGRWLLKRIDSSAGLHVTEADAARREALAGGDQRRYVLQQFIPGQSYSALLLATSRGTELVGLTRQWIGEPLLGSHGFRYCGSLGPARVPRCAAILRRMGAALVSAFPLRGIFGIDLVWDGHTAWPVEINPRYTASCEVLERALGRSLISDHIAACEGCPLAPRHRYQAARPRRKFGKAILFARRQLTIGPRVLDTALRANRHRRWPQAADLPHAGQVVERGHPVLTVFAAGTTMGQVRSRLLQRARFWQHLLGEREGARAIALQGERHAT